MTTLVTQAAWVLSAAFVLSGVYELYRVTPEPAPLAMTRSLPFLRKNIVLYAVAVGGHRPAACRFAWAPIIALVFSVAVIGASIAFYNPRIMLERQPGVIDWFEDLVFTGLLFVAAALLAYQRDDSASASSGRGRCRPEHRQSKGVRVGERAGNTTRPEAVMTEAAKTLLPAIHAVRCR